MKKSSDIMRIVCLSGLIFIAISQLAYAMDYSRFISEAYLRSEFTFNSGDTLKYSQCKKKSFLICTYVWGGESKKDAVRIKYGRAPDGSKLQITYAQAKSRNDFQRILSQYKVAEKVDELGEDAVWSAKRRQLSFITDKNLIVHIHIDDKSTEDLKAKSTSVAENLLEQL